MARTIGVPDSLRLCLARPGFVDRFLELLAERTPRLRERVESADPRVIRLTAQRCMTTLILAAAGVVPAAGFEARFRECAGSPGPGASVDVYADWAESLLAAVREADPDMDPALAADWRATLMAGARLLGARAPDIGLG